MSRTPGSFVYFIQCGKAGPIKIGHSRYPQRRLAQLQTAHSEPLRLLHVEPGDRVDEEGIHAWFAHARVRGEWFRPTLRLIWYLRDCAAVRHGLPYSMGEHSP